MSQITNTLIIGKVSKELDSCSSTNLYAKDLIAKSKPLDGTIIITDKQTAGRGQFGNVWQSEIGKNLTFSIIIYPKISVNQQFYLSKIASIACVKAFKKLTNLDFQIKWPNDIYYKNRKTGGLLIENQVSGQQISSSVVGMGLNINQENFENLPNASSLYNLTKYLFNKKKVLEVLLKELDVLYLKLLQGKFQEITDEYLSFLKDYKQFFAFEHLGLKKTGKFIGVRNEGQIEVLVDNNVELFSFKEITWLIK